jgi:4-aminobutyrate aminotransferase-like enzyme
MSDTVQKYKDYVMTGFMKSVVPIVIDKASGAVVTDINGREYLDCFAGISVVNAGHCNPHVIAAAKAQMEKLVHCSSYIYHVQPVADLAEKIAQIAPRGLTKTFFGNGGAEAIEGAMKLARLYTGKHEFIALHASFHGRSWGRAQRDRQHGTQEARRSLCCRCDLRAGSLRLSLAVAEQSRGMRTPVRPGHRRCDPLYHFRRRSRIHRGAGHG